MFQQVDNDGYSLARLDPIVENLKGNNTVNADDGFVFTKSINRHLRNNTEGWSILIIFIDGYSQWTPLRTITETILLERLNV